VAHTDSCLWPPQLCTCIQLCQAGYGLITTNTFRKGLRCNPPYQMVLNDYRGIYVGGIIMLNVQNNKPDSRCIHKSFQIRLKSHFWKVIFFIQDAAWLRSKINHRSANKYVRIHVLIGVHFLKCTLMSSEPWGGVVRQNV